MYSSIYYRRPKRAMESMKIDEGSRMKRLKAAVGQAGRFFRAPFSSKLISSTLTSSTGTLVYVPIDLDIKRDAEVSSSAQSSIIPSELLPKVILDENALSAMLMCFEKTRDLSHEANLNLLISTIDNHFARDSVLQNCWAIVRDELYGLDHIHSHDEYVSLDTFLKRVESDTNLVLPSKNKETALKRSNVRTIIGYRDYKHFLERFVPSSFSFGFNEKKNINMERDKEKKEKEKLELESPETNMSISHNEESWKGPSILPVPISQTLDYSITDRISERMIDSQAMTKLDRLIESVPVWDEGMSTLLDGAEKRKKQLVAMRLLPLSTDDEAKVNACLYSGSSSDVMVNKFNVALERVKIQVLRPATWLNDEIINFTMSMLQERDNLLCANSPDRRSSHFLNSYFIDRLLDTERGYLYSNVRRWTRKFNIFEKDKIFCPVNLSNTHWALAVIYMTQKKIIYYDSMSGSGHTQLKALWKWLDDESKDKLKCTFDYNGWKSFSASKEITPQQTNGYDCGVFVCMNADFLSDDLSLDFSQNHMALFRKKICANILRGSFDYDL